MAVIAIAIAMAAVVLALPAQAQTYTVLYNFTGTGGDGGGPIGRLIRDSAGNLYGTTTGGGAFGFGTVFKLDARDTETVLYSFAGGASGDGESPYSGLTRDRLGNFYGTTFKGGTYGLGTIYKIDATTHNETLVYSFAGVDGANPVADIVQDNVGNLYSTTHNGGFSGYGTVYKLAPDGTETVLYSFPSAQIALYPSGLVRDAAGNIYGTTGFGGAQESGTVFELDASGTETTLYSFTALDGEDPYATLIRDEFGNLYDTTEAGGVFGRGTVFKLDNAGTEKVLYSFTGKRDGGYPYSGIIRDAEGNFYGTTQGGGALKYGTIFKIGPAGRISVLHSFTGTDGYSSFTSLIEDSAGNLYGVTAAGGAFDVGVVFKVTP